MDGTHLLVIASNAGAPRHPDWHHNLMAHPAVTVEVQDQIYQATAIVAEGEERQRLWEQVVAAAPFFAEHQAKISRSIPVILLKRQAEEAMASCGSGSLATAPAHKLAWSRERNA